MKIPAGTHYAQCRRCGGIVGVAAPSRFHDYLPIWQLMDVDVRVVVGDPAYVDTGHGEGCPNNIAIESTPGDGSNVWYDILFAKEVPGV